tara:strand:+ start:148 stop:399 length:252 start_codon:yes stop_codon:yes gene_type:complete
MNNYSQELWNQILQQAEMNMDDGTCSMYRTVVIPMKVRQGKYSELKDWEKIFFYDGVKNGSWSKNGIHLKNNNPYNTRSKITE